MAVITRKHQILAEIESTEGGGATFTSASAIQVFEPAYSDQVDRLDRVPAGPTLSRDFAPVGRKTRTVTFRSDFRGSGSTATAPDFAKLLQASAYKRSSVFVLTLAAVTGSTAGFQPSEQVFQGASYATATAVGVIVGILSGGNAPLERGINSGEKLLVAVLSGTFATSTATTGNSSGAISTISAAAADATTFSYQPTSEKRMNVLTGAYTGTPPAAVGEVLSVERAGLKVGAAQILLNNSGFVDIDVNLLWGSILNADTLRSAGNGTATVSAPPTQTRTPSLALRSNLDGRNRLLLGSRGDFTAEGQVGEPMQFSWTFTGDIGASTDALPIATTGLSTVRAPRLLGAIAQIRSGAFSKRIPVKRVTLNQGNTVNPNLDANRAGGANGSNVTDRQPNLVLSVDVVNGDVDWEGIRDNGTVVGVALILGDTRGNICALVLPNGQVAEVSPSDADGVATFDVTVQALRIAESGDDELYIVQI